VLFNFDQTVFSDADATAGVGASANQPGSVSPVVMLTVSLDADPDTTPNTTNVGASETENATDSEKVEEKDGDRDE
jgi:hypothetical protein